MARSRISPIFAVSLIWAGTVTPPGPAQAADFPDLREFQAKPDASGNETLNLSIMATARDVMIGGYNIRQVPSLVVCEDGTSTNCQTSYASAPGEPGGVLLRFAGKKAATLDMSLRSKLKGGGSTLITCMDDPVWDDSHGFTLPCDLMNIHTHGLLVSPYAPRQTGPTEMVLGDNVFHYASGASTAASAGPSAPAMPGMDHPDPMNALHDGLHYKIEIPANKPDGTGIYPMGLSWFHPHVHHVAKMEVSSGMAGMISIGYPSDYLCLKPGKDDTCLDKKGDSSAFPTIRNMLLRDIQIVRKDSQSDYLPYSDEIPAFCGDQSGKTAPPRAEATQKGECAANTTDIPKDWEGRWLFTINGALYPTWSLGKQGDVREIWRIQNASANITYDLSLIRKGASPSGSSPKLTFQILSLDGAGLAPASSGTLLEPPRTDGLLLLPGSRAEILVSDTRNCAACGEETYQLLNAAFATGDTYKTGNEDQFTGDTWPTIGLGEITLPARTRMAAQPDVKLSAIASSSLLASRAKKMYSDRELEDIIAKNCSSTNPAAYLREMKNAQAAKGVTRRIYFGINSSDGENFLLGSSLVYGGKEHDNQGRVISDIELKPMSMYGPADLCVLRALGTEEETWELVNVSAEMHNFHIHQLKFQPIGLASWRTPSEVDRKIIPHELVFKTGEETLMHDSIIVPRGTVNCREAVTLEGGKFFLKRNSGGKCLGNGAAGDESGMSRVKISFSGTHLRSEPDGTPMKFVYHCHILEHEDKGMMASIAIIDPESHEAALK